MTKEILAVGRSRSRLSALPLLGLGKSLSTTVSTYSLFCARDEIYDIFFFCCIYSSFFFTAFYNHTVIRAGNLHEIHMRNKVYNKIANLTG